MTRPILFVGDIHLGRSPYRLEEAKLNPSELDPAEAWNRVVRYAEDPKHRVQAVVLAGDVVDREKDRFEAWGHLQRGVARLVKAGVRTLGVAGNHDHIALPLLAERIKEFKLIGHGGTWERIELEQVDLIGWSFPARHHQRDPLESPGLEDAISSRRPNSLPVGVLHGDLDVHSSNYAPVRTAHLRDTGLAAWFLGHIHQPGTFSEPPYIGYLGSLVGLDRGEEGPRGPWLVTPTSASSLTATQLPLGPLYWKTVSVDLSDHRQDLITKDDIHGRIETSIARAATEDTWLSRGDFQAVGCSILLTGHIPLEQRQTVTEFIRDLRLEELRFETSTAPWAVVKVKDRTQSLLSLQPYAEERTPLGELVRLLERLSDGTADAIPPSILAAITKFDPTPWTRDLERTPLPDPLELTKQVVHDLARQLHGARTPPEQG